MPTWLVPNAKRSNMAATMGGRMAVTNGTVRFEATDASIR